MLLPTMLLTAALAAPVQEPVPAAEQQAAAPSMSAAAHIDAGVAAFRKRRFTSARQHFEAAVAAEPNSAAAHFYLGYTIYKIAEPKRPFHPEKQEAAGHFAEAYKLDPQFKPVWASR